MENTVNEVRRFLRHATATIAYRGAKALRGAPPEFAHFKAGPTTRTPLEILAHIGDLLEVSAARLRGPARWKTAPPDTWERQTARFHAALASIDLALASDTPIDVPLDKWYQGPFADALTHVGQLAMLRRMFGAPVKGEAYFYADIQPGRVGPDQTTPDAKYEFE
ncbi:MAG: DinB family protein [candidate division Zixibacteria bacterium]|nr:DinB family protein [candidate division Zixibacteria bacterium]